MSLWATALHFDADDHADHCARWVPCTREEAQAAGRSAFAGDRHWRYDSTRPCTCQAGPLRYQGSHVLPSDDDPRGGCVEVAMIPGFIEREGRTLDGAGPDDTPCWPWIRLSVGEGTAVLTRTQVAEIHAYLGEWLSNTGEAR